VALALHLHGSSFRRFGCCYCFGRTHPRRLTRRCGPRSAGKALNREAVARRRAFPQAPSTFQELEHAIFYRTVTDRNREMFAEAVVSVSSRVRRSGSCAACSRSGCVDIACTHDGVGHGDLAASQDQVRRPDTTHLPMVQLRAFVHLTSNPAHATGIPSPRPRRWEDMQPVRSCHDELMQVRHP
jgi:hypothetical protein